MPVRAQVTSIDALESFRAKLILYLSKMRPALDEGSEEVNRTRIWLQSQQRMHWEREFKLRRRALEEAQQALFSAKLSNMQEASALHFMAVQRAQRACNDAEEKRRKVKGWDGDLDNRAEPMLKQIEQLNGFVISEITKAIVYLAETIRTLEEYAQVKPMSSGTAPTTAPTAESVQNEAGAPPTAPATGNTEGEAP